MTPLNWRCSVAKRLDLLDRDRAAVDVRPFLERGEELALVDRVDVLRLLMRSFRPRHFGLTLGSKNGAFTISLFFCSMSQFASLLAATYSSQSGSAHRAARLVSRSAAFS